MHYKFEGDGPDYITKELRECARYVAELDTRMEELNNEIQKYGKLSDKKSRKTRSAPGSGYRGYYYEKNL